MCKLPKDRIQDFQKDCLKKGSQDNSHLGNTTDVFQIKEGNIIIKKESKNKKENMAFADLENVCDTTPRNGNFLHF